MNVDQQALSLERSTCGYCGSDLEANDDGDVTVYECPRCVPLLADIANEQQWRQFAIDARKEQQRGRRR